jgi:single-stranded DNA-binding protein
MNLTIQVGRFTRDPEVTYGDKVILRGRFQNNNYTKNDGTKVYGDQLIIDKIEFAQTKPDQTEENFHPPDEDEEMPFKD